MDSRGREGCRWWLLECRGDVVTVVLGLKRSSLKIILSSFQTQNHMTLFDVCLSLIATRC